MTGLPLRVLRERCDQCIFGPERIVSSRRMADVLATCRRRDTHFICHKATIEGGQDVCCRGFYDTQPATGLRDLAEQLDAVEFVDEQDLPNAPPWQRA